MTDKEIIEQLDSRQLSVCDNVEQNHWLSNKKNLLKFYEWNTFFRRNLDAYAVMYFGFKLHPYQRLELYEMNVNAMNVIVGSRATAKSYIVAEFAVCKASLYPKSKIVICSATIGQARLIVSEKIKNELIPQSPILEKEIAEIKNSKDEIMVRFHNGSTITVVPALDSARGNRSTCIIYEEFRMIQKFIVDSVISPFQIIRPADFLEYDEYSYLAEEPTDIYISSAWYSSHWMMETINDALKRIRKGVAAFLLGLDYSVSLKHKIKTKNQIISDKRKFDPITFEIEYCNRMIRENTSAYFTYKMFLDNQRCKKPFYPRKTVDVISKRKNPYSIPKQDGEIRVVSCDMAFSGGKKNDNSIFSCLRLIPETTLYSIEGDGEEKTMQRGYRKIVPYLEAVNGVAGELQAIRIKQLFEDFEADYCVLDTRNGGTLIYQMLAKVLYDAERDVEYRPWVCINNDQLANSIKTEGALPVLYAVNATQALNSIIATEMRANLMSGMVDFLISYNDAVENILPKIAEYNEAPDADTQLFYETPYLETAELINECVELKYERKEQTGVIVISEQGNNRKDRYTSVSYGIHFATQLEMDLLSDSYDHDFQTFVN